MPRLLRDNHTTLWTSYHVIDATHELMNMADMIVGLQTCSMANHDVAYLTVVGAVAD